MVAIGHRALPDHRLAATIIRRREIAISPLAWYGHLKYRFAPLWIVILANWGIAFFEYCLQVPANRIGHGEFTAGQLKIIQEVITLIVIAAFPVVYLGDPLGWRYAGAFACLLGAIAFMFVGRA
jgi:hypothetical protein